MSKSSRSRSGKGAGSAPEGADGRGSRRGRTVRGQAAREGSVRGSEDTGSRAAWGRGDWIALLLLAAVVVLVFANGAGNQFVWDDKKQIVENDLIKDPRFLGKALTSDVWAFKGDKGEAWSNYWRPVFVLWMIANYRAFGLTSTAGWHAANIALHAGVVALAFWFLRRLGLSRALALAVSLIFAVHPVHAESVTWIAGSPDLFVSGGLLAALICLLAYLAPRPDAARPPLLLVAAVAAFTVSLLSKEITIFFPAIVFVTALLVDRRRASEPAARLKNAVVTTLPFAIATAIYAGVHYKILGGKTQLDVQWVVTPAMLLLSAPSILLFYLREALFPLWIAPAYPLRALTPSDLSFFNCLLPALVVGAAFAGLFWLARRDAVRGIGLALFLVPLLPALNIKAFAPDRIVADRYLYLPSLGLFMILIPSLAELIAWISPASSAREGAASRTARSESAAFWIGVAAAGLLGFQTIRYNRVWESEMTLWTAALASDPNSASALNEYGLLLYQAKRYPEARAALDRALSITSLTTSHLVRSDVATAEKRYADAEKDVKDVLSVYPDYPGAYERLALIYQDQRRLADAEATLRTAIEKVPHRRGQFTDSLAIILYVQNRKPEALAALEAARPFAANEMNPGAQSILFHLGSLYAEMGRPADARAALEEYLRISVGNIDDVTRTQQATARATLAGLAR